jgi:hypothetical protein
MATSSTRIQSALANEGEKAGRTNDDLNFWKQTLTDGPAHRPAARSDAALSG